MFTFAHTSQSVRPETIVPIEQLNEWVAAKEQNKIQNANIGLSFDCWLKHSVRYHYVYLNLIKLRLNKIQIMQKWHSHSLALVGEFTSFIHIVSFYAVAVNPFRLSLIKTHALKNEKRDAKGTLNKRDRSSTMKSRQFNFVIVIRFNFQLSSTY